MSDGITSLVKPVSYEETLASLPPRRSPYEAFSYLLQPPSVRDRAPAQPAPAPMPTQPMPSDPVATQPPPATPPMQTDPTPRPDPMPVTPEAFDPTVPVSDPMQPERPDPIIDTKKTPTTLAELEAMLGYKWIKNEDTSPIRNTMYTDQDRLRDLAKQYGIALPPDAPIDMTGFEDPPLDSTQPDGTMPPVGTLPPTPPVGETIPVGTPPTNMPAPGTVIRLPYGGSFTIPDDIQERIDAAKAAQAGTTPPPVATPSTPSLPPVGTTIPLPFGGGLTVTQDMQDRINAARAQANANQAVSDTITMPDMDEEDRQRVEAKRQFPMGGRRGLMSREAIENLRKRVDEMRTPPPTPMIELPAGAPRTIPEDAISEDLSRLPQGIVAGGPRPDGRLVYTSVPVVSPPPLDVLQNKNGFNKLRDILGRASEVRDSLRPADTRNLRRAPQLPMPRRVPTVPPLKPARRQIPVNTDKQEMVRRALAERMQNVGRLLGRGRGR